MVQVKSIFSLDKRASNAPHCLTAKIFQSSYLRHFLNFGLLAPFFFVLCGFGGVYGFFLFFLLFCTVLTAFIPFYPIFNLFVKDLKENAKNYQKCMFFDFVAQNLTHMKKSLKKSYRK